MPFLFKRKRPRNAAFDLVCVESNPGPDQLVPYGGGRGGGFVEDALRTLVRYGPDAVAAGRKLAKTYERYLGRAGATPRLVGVETNPGPGNRTRNATRSARGPKPSKLERSKQSKRSVSAPLAVGSVITNHATRFVLTGGVGPSEYSSDSGLRISGHGAMNIFARSSDGPLDSGLHAMLGGGTSPYRIIDLAFMDTRLANIARTFSFYTFRRLTIHYHSSIGTATRGNMLMAIVPNSDDIADNPFPSFQSVTQYAHNVNGPVWEPSSVTVTSPSSTKCYRTDTISSNNLSLEAQNRDRIQYTLLACGLNVDNTTDYGFFTMDYVIDLYEPSPIEVSVA